MGNSSSSKSATKKTCSFCRKESCQGDGCKYFYSGEAVTGRTSAGFSSSYPNAAPVVSRSSSSTQHVPLGTASAASGEIRPGIPTQQSTAGGTRSTAVYPAPFPPVTLTKAQSGSTVQQSNVGVSSSKTCYVDALPKTTSASQFVDKSWESKNISHGGNSAHLAAQSKPLPLPNPSHFSTVQPAVKVTTNLPTTKNLDPSSVSKQYEGAGSNIHGIVEKKSAESEARGLSTAKSDLRQVGKPKVELNSIDVKNSVPSDANERKPKHKHSPHAVKYEGVVLQVIGSRSAKVRVYERNGVPAQKSEWEADDVVKKHALLVIDKLINDESGSFYPTKTFMREVIRKGDIVALICTAHNNQSSGFQLYAHEAWLTGEKTEINDAESLASFVSISGSDTQGSTSSKAKNDRIALQENVSSNKKADSFTLGNNAIANISNGNSCETADVVSQWLDSNKYCLNKNENSKPLKLIGGCHYIGKAIEIRSSHGFIVEISSKEGRQFVFVLPSFFYPQGINGPALSLGTSVESYVNIGDEIVVIPVRNVAMQEGKFEWVANKAWPKNILPVSSTALSNKKSTELIISSKEKQNQLKDVTAEQTNLMEKQTVTYIKSLYPNSKNWKDFDGEIISLQFNWGLVKEKENSQVAYAFTRENTYLFGLCLEHFILDDIFEIGQPVKFSLDIDEPGTMHAIAVWSGNKLPDYHSFDIATGKFCEENKIKFATEESLIQHGKGMYLGR
ncbi:uncharacterized protein LOC124168909 isoform X2 [Ischnura elegans]|uniref:uncharacterized protein LOC124168909 isoform X2 n=1 Tax=Ischnura elegans TaxID=197161 RepID=UPI001ED879D7|nr:uncharacterized protein LOC124168909 isoform X2 [Ischnura elegans]